MLDLNSLLLFSEHPKKLADFYKKVLDKDPDWQDQGYYGFMVGTTFLTIGPHNKVKGKNPNPERILINFETEEIEEEFERIKGLGAKVIQDPYNPGEEPTMQIATFEDPDGNYFQLMTPFQGTDMSKAN